MDEMTKGKIRVVVIVIMLLYGVYSIFFGSFGGGASNVHLEEKFLGYDKDGNKIYKEVEVADPREYP